MAPLGLRAFGFRVSGSILVVCCFLFKAGRIKGFTLAAAQALSGKSYIVATTFCKRV